VNWALVFGLPLVAAVVDYGLCSLGVFGHTKRGRALRMGTALTAMFIAFWFFQRY
jgi:hypothetical protein